MRFRTITIILILLYFFGMGLSYNRAIPPFESSDEAEHFLYIHSILTHHALPVIKSREAVALEDSPTAIWNNHVHHAPLYYMIGAGLTLWSERSDINDFLQPNTIIFSEGVTANNPNKWLHSPHRSDGDTFQAVFILRVINTLIGMLTLCVIYRTGRRAFGQPAVALGAMGFVAILPSFIVVHSSINNDPLVIFFYSLGLLWLVRAWGQSTFSKRDMLSIGLIVSGAALAKLTGLSLAGVVGLALLIGVMRKHLSFQQFIRVCLSIAGIVLLLAGWWYVRNYQLYGDFFAQSATQALWGREFDTPVYFTDEIIRFMRSFWLMVGYRHQPILAEYTLVNIGIVILFLGLIGLSRRMPTRARELVRIMMMTGFIVLVMLLVGTVRVDISYGRILFPALPALALCVMWGIWLFARKWGIIVAMVVLIGLTFQIPQTIQNAYSPLKVLAANPQPVDGLVIEHVNVEQAVVTRDQPLQFDVIFSGRSEDNPYLIVTAVDSTTQKFLAGIQVYPGMSPTHALEPDGRYQASVTLPIDLPIPGRYYPNAYFMDHLQPLSPRMVDLYLAWSNNRWVSTRYDGAVWLDKYYQDTNRYGTIKRHIVFGDLIQLEEYKISVDEQSMAIELWWTPLDKIAEDWVLTVQLFDQAGNLITQTDGQTAGYPSSRWVEGVTFEDHRTLSWDIELPEDQYDVMLAWYRLSDLERLPITSETAINHIILLETVYISR